MANFKGVGGWIVLAFLSPPIPSLKRKEKRGWLFVYAAAFTEGETEGEAEEEEREGAWLGVFTCQMLGLPRAPVWLPGCGHARALCELGRSDELAGCYGEEPCHVARALLPAV